MRYISLFSGIGGLESESAPPVLCCEIDEDARIVLGRRFKNTDLHDDVETLTPPKVDVVVAGWPCQDISKAGMQSGLKGIRSSLFFQIIRIVNESKAHTVVLENVPNLLDINKGEDFKTVLDELESIGLSYCSWRLINALELGVPQDRNRIFVVASRIKNIALALHREIKPPKRPSRIEEGKKVLSFYWTASARSLCLREDFVPTLKVGAPSHKGGISPVAVCYDKKVRKLTVKENLGFQGFHDMNAFEGIKRGSALRMAGNAVCAPVGQFAVDSIFHTDSVSSTRMYQSSRDIVPPDGYREKKQLWKVVHEKYHCPEQILEYLDETDDLLSNQACAGLCCRIIRTGTIVPSVLFEALYEQSRERTKLLGTKINSFEILDSELDGPAYLESLRDIEKKNDAQMMLF